VSQGDWSADDSGQNRAIPVDSGSVASNLRRLIYAVSRKSVIRQEVGVDSAYRDYRDRYRAMATELGFEGHMKWAEAMTG
jgi:adenylate cyclase